MMLHRREERVRAPRVSEERAATMVQAAFRGMQNRQTSAEPSPYRTTVVVIPVRQAARMLRERRDRRTGCIRLLLYIIYIWVVTLMILSLTDRPSSFQLREAVVRRLSSIKTGQHAKDYEHLVSIDDIAEWIPAAAVALRDDPHGWEDATSPEEALAQGYLPSYGLFQMYNRPIPTLLVTMRRRETSWEGCGTKIGGAEDWIRPCWGDTEDTASWEGAHSGSTYTWDPDAESFVVRFSLGYPPVPQETELAMWDSSLLDGFLSDRTLDVTVTLIVVNGNNDLLCSAKIRWNFQNTGFIGTQLDVVAFPTTYIPQGAGWMLVVSWLGRGLVVVLTVLHIAQLRQDIRTRSTLMYGPDGIRIGSAILHIGSMIMISLTLCGPVVGKLAGDLELPDVSLLSDGTSMTSNEAGIVNFLRKVEVKVTILHWVDWLMGFTGMFVTAKLVKMLDFDPRLSLSSRTVAHAGTELGYFSLSCALTVFGYAMSGSVMFGSDTKAFTSKTDAVMTLLGGIDGETGAASELKTHGFVAVFYYWSFIFVAVVLFLNIAVAILVDSYASVREDDKRRSTQERILAHPSLAKLVGELELSRPSMVCTQLPCTWARKALNRRSRHRRTLPAAASLSPEANAGRNKEFDTSRSGSAPEPGVRARLSSASFLPTGRISLRLGQKADKYWVQPWAAPKEYGVDDLANALELIGETKTTQGGAGMAREHWKVIKKRRVAANVAQAIFGSFDCLQPFWSFVGPHFWSTSGRFKAKNVA